ncbi:hypothetical protein HGRIS_005857 [Hohenbuehelia grisea]|uniref:RNA helicase n=1 Tax=Hohenbuehelia grisea TaxID=104357 RepID=A0ABR3JYJ8_9AGAR
MGKHLRLLSHKNRPKSPQKHSKPAPWVDVSDDERPRKIPRTGGLSVNGQGSRKVNGVSTNGHGGPSKASEHHSPGNFHNSSMNGRHSPSGDINGHRRKKARRGSLGATQENIDVQSGGKFSEIQEQRKLLPIAQGKDALLEEIRRNDVTILLGETGSGKTTQVPQYILEGGLADKGMIAVTQPRRVAATSLAARVSVERNTKLGHLVGYSVRFDEKNGSDTRIKYLTDGMIMRELMSDPLLSKYSVIIVDEAHERTLRTDLLISNLKSIQKTRNQPVDAKGKGPASHLNPLKIIVMSATLDAEKFSKFFAGAKVVYVKGRQHPVKIFHTAEGQNDYLEAAMRTFFQVHNDQGPGDVLIFLPGQEDIESLNKSIQLFANQLPQERMEVLTCPMYAAQAPGQNSKVFLAAPTNTRKCILATNIAETSLTIPGVKYVIDTGKCKEKQYLARDSGGGFDTLLTKDITKSSANQRAGRAGREGSGMCFRLYTEDAYNAMPPMAEPEIRRCSLTSSVLQLKCFGQDIQELEFMDGPDLDSVISALKTLYLLGALDKQKQLTSTGRDMASFPLEATYARVVLASREYGCTREILEIVSVLSASSKLFQDIAEQRDSAAEARRALRHPSGDHLTVLAAVRSYTALSSNPETATRSARRQWCDRHYLNERALLEARDIYTQLRQTCSRQGIDCNVSCGERDEPILKALAHGLVQNSALLQPDGASYKQTMGRSVVKIHPSSVLADKKVPAIIYNELVYTNQIYARGVSSISKSFFNTIPALNQRQA